MSLAPAILSWLSGADRRRVGYYAVVTLYLCSWVVIASGNRPDTRLLPVTVSVALLLGVCVRAVSTRLSGGGRTGPDTSLGENRTPPVDTRGVVVAFAWLGVLVAAVTTLGLVGGIGLFVTVVVSRYEGYRRGLLVGAGTVLFVVVLFVWLLDLPTVDPYALELLERGGFLGG